MIGVPVHVLPLLVVFMPLGQRHVKDLILILANRHKWLHPPLFTSHGLEAEDRAYFKKILRLLESEICTCGIILPTILFYFTAIYQ